MFFKRAYSAMSIESIVRLSYFFFFYKHRLGFILTNELISHNIRLMNEITEINNTNQMSSELLEAYIRNYVSKYLREELEVFVRTNEQRAKELSTIERVIQVEEELKSLREIELARFEASEKRFESLQKEMNTRFEALQKEMNTRFEALQKEMNARFEASDRKFESLQKEMNIRFESLQKEMIARFEASEKRFEALQREMTARFEASEKKV